MSQYPSPYIPPQPGQGGWGYDYYQAQAAAQYLRPARNAAIAMFVVGGLGIACGVCFGGLGVVMPPEVLKSSEMLPPTPELNMPVEQFLRIVLVAFGILSLLAGIAMVVLGLFVRRGSKAAIVTSIILTSLGLVYALINVASALLGGAGTGGNPAAMLGGICSAGLVLALFAVPLALLIPAMKAASAMKAAQLQYQMQYWQYMQQQQLYNQPGGYNPVPQPPPGQPPIQPPTPQAPPPPPQEGQQ